MLSIPPALPNFLFMSLLSVNETFIIFLDEPMDILSLSISKIWKECICTMLNEDERTSISGPHSTGKARSFRFLRRIVLSKPKNAFM